MRAIALVLISLSCHSGSTIVSAETRLGKPMDEAEDTGSGAKDTGLGSTVRVPAEWEDQMGVWMQWPRHHERWSRPDFARIIEVLRTHGGVQILIDDATAEAEAREFLAERLTGLDQISFAPIQSNWSWMRDNGPVWVERDGWLAVQDWGFDGWGEADTAFGRDDAVPCQVADRVGVPCEQYDVLTERGAMEFNGVDTLIASWTTLHARNPEMSREALKAVFQAAFGVRRVIWLEGAAVDDLTDGHVDGIARFIQTDTVAVGQYVDPAHPDAAMYDQAADTLAAAGLLVERIDIPGSFTYLDAEMSAIYLNWLVVDGAVLMSSFARPDWDAAAKTRVQDFFPDREVIAVDTRELWYGGGGVHCVTNDMPNLPLESKAGEDP